ncbi:HIT family protein, partial [Campylobacter coli]|nr:HIT family protein [Campylobacter coli]
KQQRELKDLNLPSFDEFVIFLKNKMD